MKTMTFDFTKNATEDSIVMALWNYLEDKNLNVTKELMNELFMEGFFDSFFKIVQDEYDFSYPDPFREIDIDYCLDEFRNAWENRGIVKDVDEILGNLDINYDVLIEDIDGSMISDSYDPRELEVYLTKHRFSKKAIKNIKLGFEEFYDILTDCIAEYGNPETLPQYYTRDMFTVDVVPFNSDTLVQLAFDVNSMKSINEYVQDMLN